MYTDSDLENAVTKGIFTRDSVERFRKDYEQQHASPIVDEENFRLVSGFNDIFVVVISVVVLLSSFSLFNSMFGDLIGFAVTACAAWGLAEYYIRIRRMALPSIVLLLAFIPSATAVMAFLYLSAADIRELPINDLVKESGFVIPLFSLIAALAHWLRFRVPVTIALITAAVAATVLAILFTSFPQLSAYLYPMMMVAGGVVFIFAMGWDISDTRRVTRRSDVAFWLHLLSAPLLMHPLFKIIGVMDGDVSTSVAAVILGVFVLITLISLLIDRRALMVSSLAYVLYAMNALFDNVGTLGQQLGLTGLIVGCSMVLLTAYWDKARTSLLKPLPDSVSRLLPNKASDGQPS